MDAPAPVLPKLRVVIVEDDPTVRLFLKDVTLKNSSVTKSWAMPPPGRTWSGPSWKSSRTWWFFRHSTCRT